MSTPNSAVRVRYIGDDLSITTYVHEYTGYAWPVADDRDEPGAVADVGLMVFVPDDDPRKRFEVMDEDLEELAE